MSELMETICNSIFLILEAISRFDIMAIDQQRLAELGQIVADGARVVYRFIDIIIVIVRNVK